MLEPAAAPLVPRLRSGPSAPGRADVLRRRWRGRSSNPIVYVLGFESRRDNIKLDSASWVKATQKTWRRERDSNPRRAFDPYTLSRAGLESKAVYAIMKFALFLAILSTPVHSRLQKTFRTVPYGQLSTHGRSVSQARPRAPGVGTLLRTAVGFSPWIGSRGDLPLDN